MLTPSAPGQLRYWEDGFVAVEGGVIVELGAYDGRATTDLRPHLLTPGFVDAHVHYPQARVVGAASGPLLAWLERSVFPEETRFADPAYAEQVAGEFAAGLAAAGTTLAMIYGSVHTQACELLLRALDRRGLRAVAGPTLMDRDVPEALTRPAAQALAELAELEARWRGHERLRVAVIPRFALSCSEELMRGAGELAQQRGLFVSTHIAETREEVEQVAARFAAPDYLGVYEACGLLHARTVLAHCIHLSGDEWQRLAEARAIVAHCPDSNAFLGSGTMPIGEALDHGVRVALGTDIAAGRSLRVTHSLAFAHDNALRAGRRLDPARLFWWATRGGALALGCPEAGELAVGRAADMVLHPLTGEIEGVEAVLAQLVFALDRPAPLRTWVAGELVHGTQG